MTVPQILSAYTCQNCNRGIVFNTRAHHGWLHEDTGEANCTPVPVATPKPHHTMTTGSSHVGDDDINYGWWCRTCDRRENGLSTLREAMAQAARHERFLDICIGDTDGDGNCALILCPACHPENAPR